MVYLFPLLAGLALLASDTDRENLEKESALRFGVISPGDVYTFLRIGRLRPDMLRVRVRGYHPERERYTLPRIRADRHPIPYPFQWRIAHDYFWAIGPWHDATGTIFHLYWIHKERIQHFPADQLYENRVFADVERPVVTEKATAMFEKWAMRKGTNFASNRIPPLEGADNRRCFHGLHTLNYRYDLCPLAKDHCLVFLLEEGKTIVWDFQLEDVNEAWNLCTWKQTEVFDVPFQEGFHAWVDGETYLFVTESGKVYASAKNEQGEFKTQILWSGEDGQLEVMLLHARQNRAYLFGQDFFFELTAAKPTPIPCRKVTDGRDDIEEPLRTVYECARVLVEKQEGQP